MSFFSKIPWHIYEDGDVDAASAYWQERLHREYPCEFTDCIGYSKKINVACMVCSRRWDFDNYEKR